MNAEISTLIITAASIGFFHTILGPDHYLPFVMMSWSRKWSTQKTILITLLCGLGHIGSSVVLGLLGLSFGLAIKKLQIMESTRGNVAAWLLTGLGLMYLVWGLRRAYKSKSHIHSHTHSASIKHQHAHNHHNEHAHIHNSKAALGITPWALFVVFIFGPCEPLIPILMYPAAKSSWFGVMLVTFVFGLATIGTMLAAVMISKAGINLIALSRLQRFTHAIAGATICFCGLSIQLFGL